MPWRFERLLQFFKALSSTCQPFSERRPESMPDFTRPSHVVWRRVKRSPLGKLRMSRTRVHLTVEAFMRAQVGRSFVGTMAVLRHLLAIGRISTHPTTADLDLSRVRIDAQQRKEVAGFCCLLLETLNRRCSAVLKWAGGATTTVGAPDAPTYPLETVSVETCSTVSGALRRFLSS